MLQDCWEAQLRQTVRRFRGGRREIDYAHANAFYTALNRFLTDRLPALLRTKAVMPAFSLVCAVYCTAMEEEADSSDGGMNLLMHTCEDAWHDLMSAASVRQCVEMHRWFAEQVVSRPDAFGIDLLEEILFCDDWPAECLWKNLALLDDLLEKAPDREYRAAELLEWRADTMQALGLPEADIEAFWRRNRSYSFVRDRERSRLLAEQAYDKVIPLLQEEKRLAENDLWRELCAQVETYPQHDLAFIHALRGITPDGQWPERLEQLLQLPSTNAIRLELLADSGQWPRLFAELEQRGLLHLLEAYMEPLAAWDAEKTLVLFSRLIDTQMARAYDRDSYHRTIDRVRILRRYPGGDRTIARLLQGWKERYPRRTAMLDELNKAKRAGRL